jgi:hypothetical protein
MILVLSGYWGFMDCRPWIPFFCINIHLHRIVPLLRAPVKFCDLRQKLQIRVAKKNPVIMRPRGHLATDTKVGVILARLWGRAWRAKACRHRPPSPAHRYRIGSLYTQSIVKPVLCTEVSTTTTFPGLRRRKMLQHIRRALHRLWRTCRYVVARTLCLGGFQQIRES